MPRVRRQKRERGRSNRASFPSCIRFSRVKIALVSAAEGELALMRISRRNSPFSGESIIVDRYLGRPLRSIRTLPGRLGELNFQAAKVNCKKINTFYVAWDVYEKH